MLIAWSGGSVPSKDPLRLYAYLRDPILYLLLETALVDLGFGRTVRLREVCRAAREIMFRYFATYLLKMTPSLSTILIKGVSDRIRSGELGRIPTALFGLFEFAMVGGMFILMVRWSLSPPTMIVERRFGISALGRSSRLVRGVWWQVAGLVLGTSLMATLPLRLFRFLFSQSPLLGPLVRVCWRAIVYVFTAIVFVIFYFDRRCRLENFDLQLLAEQVRSRGGAVVPSREVGQIA